MKLDTFLDERLDLVANEYSKSTIPWVVGYSGGKDSSLVVKLIFESLMRLRKKSVPLHIVYCDTGVEIPVIADYVKTTLTGIQKQALQLSIPLICHLAVPPLQDRYFSRVIGRGYPSPTNKFRWCTDKLRIQPIQRLMSEVAGDKNIVVLGVRHSESEERKRVLAKNATSDKFYFQQSQSAGRRLFCPIVDFDTSEVWEALFTLPRPSSINVHELGTLYKKAGGECPVIRDEKGSPCGKGRFGCWTCTVVRKDKAVRGLVSEGYTNLGPLLEFRDWLMDIRDDAQYRCTVRRNGNLGLGPFRLKARQLILEKLLCAELESGLQLISSQEIKHIHELWALDICSSKYIEDAI